MESNAWCPRLTPAMIFVGSGSVTLLECDINELHIGLKGTMDALYLKDLADKSRRGLRGRVENGKSGGADASALDEIINRWRGATGIRTSSRR